MITEVISLTACSDVTIKDNFFDHEGSSRAIRLHQMAPTAVLVQPAEQIMVIGR
ncbi:hypothetical protein HQN89_13165 [Paenibacillus frigoriresistens]|nr:hypothetical protein [Paenibacillus frigoriresistens]